IVLGDTFDIQDIGVYQDRYALLFCRKTAAPMFVANTVVFLWDGVPGDKYDQKYILPGTYKCCIEREGVVYAFTQIGTTLVCHAFNGTGFVEIGRIANIVVSEE